MWPHVAVVNRSRWLRCPARIVPGADKTTGLCSASYVHGRQRHCNIGGSQVERRRRENRGAVSGEGWGLGRGCAPSQKIYEFLISKWCDMVQSGCDVFKIDECRAAVDVDRKVAVPAAEAPCSNRSTSPARGTYSSKPAAAACSSRMTGQMDSQQKSIHFY